MKRAIIFGASGDIGRAVSKKMAADGWSLYLHYCKHGDSCREMLHSFRKRYPRQDFFILQQDFCAGDEDLKRMIKGLFPVNAAVFCQGITNYSLLTEQYLAAINKIMKVNLLTPIKLTKLLEPVMLNYSHSRIIFLGSVYGQNGSAMESAYSASKAGLSRFAQAAAREVASSGLTINVVAPGAVKTKMNQAFSKKEIDSLISAIPSGRLAGSEDIAYWVCCLLNPASDYLTGQTLTATGGWLQ